MSFRLRYDELRRTPGRISRAMIPGGITQYGRNTMYSMSRSNIGVRRPTSARPTTTFIVSVGSPVVPSVSNA